MRFVFDAEKAAQAAAFLLARSRGRMEYIKLIKLLYLADRQAFIETGYPITGAWMVSMKFGPVLSEVFDEITTGARTETPWTALIARDGEYGVRLARDPGEADQLSEYDEDVLAATFDRFGACDKWALVDFTHTLPEWTDPNGSMVPIDPREILVSAGRSNAEIREIAAQVESVREMRAILAG